MTPPTDLAATPVAGPIPLVDLAVQHAQVAGEVAAGWARVTATGAFIHGPDVTAFEEEFAAFSGAGHCVGVANGTDALELALRARGIGAGDEVILPANTFIATAEAVSRAGARPVLADCDPAYLLIDPERVAERLTERTRAVMAVHLYGQMAPVHALAEVLPAGVDLIEDAAQSQGATHHGRGSGSVGAVAGTSFYPGKNLGAYGDAGAVLTSDVDTAATLRALRDHGGTRKYTHDLVGMNSRLDTVQAVVLRARLARRDAVLARLHAAGIGAGIHYPHPVHLLGAYADLGHGPGDFPVAEAAAGEILTLPLFPGITAAQQERVAAEVLAAVGAAA
jgi:dTDP-4-amino-4,6-dideoxygalactose transaminase